MADVRRTVLSLMLLGDGHVGKTSMILNLTGNEFNDSQLTTVGKESYIYQTNIKGYNLKMKIWDTAGQERFRSMSVQVIKTSDAVILVYAVNDKNSFLALDTWISKIYDLVDISKKPIIIVGNKCDIEQSSREVSFQEGEQYAGNKGYKFFETSAKTGQGILDAFTEIFNQLYNIFEPEITGQKKVDARGEVITSHKQKKKKKPCC